MKKIYFTLLFFVFIQSYSYCQQNQANHTTKNEVIKADQEDGKIENGIYKCNLFDWQIEIPSDFTITSEERIKQLEDKGYEAIQENASQGKIVSRKSNNLITFEKDKFNIFGATYESLENTKKMSFEEHKTFIFKLLEETYSGKGIKFDIVKSDLKLGKYDFFKILIHLYHPKTEQLILTQEFYTSYINNHLFSANITYQNENVGYVLSYNFVKSFK